MERTKGILEITGNLWWVLKSCKYAGANPHLASSSPMFHLRNHRSLKFKHLFLLPCFFRILISYHSLWTSRFRFLASPIPCSPSRGSPAFLNLRGKVASEWNFRSGLFGLAAPSGDGEFHQIWQNLSASFPSFQVKAERLRTFWYGDWLAG